MKATVFISFEQFLFFLMRRIAACSLAQLYSTNKHVPSFATEAKRSFILNSMLNERFYSRGLRASKLGNIAWDKYVYLLP